MIFIFPITATTIRRVLAVILILAVVAVPDVRRLFLWTLFWVVLWIGLGVAAWIILERIKTGQLLK